jgi:hypothetical protein
MPTARMCEQFPIACVATHGDPRKFREEAIRFKLFFGVPNAATYAEMFLHVNYPEAWIALAEKGAANRANMISAFVPGSS